MFLKKVKIRTKLMIGFAVIGLMVLILGWLAFFQVNRVWMDTSNLYNHPFKVNIAVRELESSITSMHRSLKDVILSENQMEMIKYLSKIDLEEKKANSNFQIVYDLYLGSKTTIDSAYNAFINWKGVRDSTILLCREGRIKEAAFRSTHNAEIYSDMLLQRIGKLKAFALMKANEFYTSVEESKNQLQVQLAFLIVLIFLLCVLIGYYLLRSITQPLSELKAATEEQWQGNYAARSQIESSNETGQLAFSFNRMADKIESEIKIKNGITLISDSMLGNEEFQEFGRSLLIALMVHSQSDAAAIYLLDEDSAVFKPGFSIGFTKEKLKSFAANQFEGEFGRTLVEKKIVHISQIPEDSVFDFAAVAGNFRPREILNLPILQNDKVIAIISLACLRVFDADTLEMLRIAEKSVTAGVISILSVQKIRDYSLKLDQQNTELEMQTKELKLQTEELHEQNAELEMQKRQIHESNRLKSEFLSSMSHELRTPLNAVIALSGVLGRKLLNKIPKDEYSYLEIIERNGKNLLNLINEILDLSRIEAGKTDLQLSKFSLNEAVGSILDTMQLQIQQKNIVVNNNINIDFPLIFTDRSKCHHILQNLIGNAVKFTEHGSIEILARIIGNEVHIAISDTGIGISEDQLPLIFNQFHQVDGSASRMHEGTGLGLAIADQYSRLLDARIEVSSKLGQGSVFTLILPFIQNDRSASYQLNSGPEQIPGESMDSISNTRQSNSSKTILIIEDSEPAIIQLSEILSEEGYQLDVARNGNEALARVKIKIPDAIILDLMMPGMDGFEVLENIRGTEATFKLPVLILTAKYLNKIELNRLTANNIHQLIQKGDVAKEELLNHIRNMIGRKKPPVPVISRKAIPVVKEGILTVLLVEDNEDNVKTIEVLLGQKHNLIIARDGVDGLHKAITGKPDLILLDISLPLKDGFMVLEEIRRTESLDQVPVIAVTARAMKGDKEHFLNHGFDDYISKPIDSNIFEETLSKWILSYTRN